MSHLGRKGGAALGREEGVVGWETLLLPLAPVQTWQSPQMRVGDRYVVSRDPSSSPSPPAQTRAESWRPK